MIYNGRKFRHELKYYINYTDYLILKNKLKFLLKKDPFSGENGDYLIRSLYFDDIYDKALFDKNTGVKNRYKYRIRIYNYSDKTIKLERKNKVGQYINKESAGLSRQDVDSILNRNYEKLDIKNPLIRDFYMEVKNEILQPKVIVDYDREAFVGNVSDIRITFDKELRVARSGYDIFDASIPTELLVRMPRLILEVKYNEFLPDYIRNILEIGASEFSAISKYVICRAAKNNI